MFISSIQILLKLKENTKQNENNSDDLLDSTEFFEFFPKSSI